MSQKETLKQLLAHRVSTFQISYQGQSFFMPDLDPPLAVVKTTMIDIHHEISLLVAVDINSLKICEIEIYFERQPFPQCLQSFSGYQEFKGIEMSQTKISKKLQEFSVKNCLHVNELFLLSAQTFTHGFAFYVKNKNFPEKLDEYKMHIGDMPLMDRIEINRHWWMKDRRVKDSCYAYLAESENSDCIAMIRDVPPITKMMISEIKRKR